MSSAPNPAAARSPAELREQLRRLKVWAGNPPFAQLARRSGVPRSTLADALAPDRDTTPRLETLVAFVGACGVDEAGVAAWSEAWRRVEAAPDPSIRAARELPRVAAELVGRAEALAALDGCLGPDGPARVVAVCGTAGIGKTALAVHWAQRVRARFPDGQLFVNLHGYDREQPVDPVEVVGTLLRSLLPAGAQLPSGLAERTALFRSLTADRRLLVVLDNADSSASVRDLLATGPGCLTLVTSRDALTGLVARDGAFRIELAPLSSADAVSLLERLTGRVDPGELPRLAERCARVPLALRLGAELVVARPQTTVAGLLGELDRAGPLDYLDAGGDEASSVRAMFTLSYRKLPADAARAFQLLGLHPGADYDVHALAALFDADVEAARTTMRALRRAYLVEEPRPGRYAMHDLLRSYAGELAERTTPAERSRAIARLLDYYGGAAAQASLVLYPYLLDVDWLATLVPDGMALPALDDEPAARAWFDAEAANLVTVATSEVARDHPGALDAISSAMHRYLKDTAQYVQGEAVHGAALAAARRAPDRAAEGRALLYLAGAYHWVGRYADALQLLGQAQGLFTDSGDTGGLVQCLNGIGIAEYRLGRMPQADELFRRTAELARQIGSPFAEANAQSNAGMCLEQLGRYGPARALYQDALELYRRAGYRGGEGSAVENLGSVELRLGEIDRATGHLGEALAIAREVGWVGLETTVLNNLGRAAMLAGRTDAAAGHYERALVRARQGADRVQTAMALDGLGDVARARDQRDAAIQRWTESHLIYAELGVPQAADVAAKIAAAPDGRRSPLA